ncbi:hypothetical protein Efla_004387 [Eimeria flavescens]
MPLCQPRHSQQRTAGGDPARRQQQQQQQQTDTESSGWSCLSLLRVCIQHSALVGSTNTRRGWGEARLAASRRRQQQQQHKQQQQHEPQQQQKHEQQQQHTCSNSNTSTISSTRISRRGRVVSRVLGCEAGRLAGRCLSACAADVVAGAEGEAVEATVARAHHRQPSALVADDSIVNEGLRRHQPFKPPPSK